MIKKTLADKTRALILKCGDRDDFRIFNANIVKHKYLSFYPYFDTDSNDDILWDTPSILIGFSNNDKEGALDNQDAYMLNAGKDDDMFFVSTGLAYMLDQKRVVISTSELEPIPIEPISWDKVFDAEVISTGNWEDMCTPVAEYCNCDSYPYEFDNTIIRYLERQTSIRMNVIFRDGSVSNVRKTTLVYENDECVGVIKQRGYDGSNSTTYCFDEGKWLALMQKIKEESGVDKLLKKRIVHVMDWEADADEFFYVPGVTTTED